MGISSVLSSRFQFEVGVKSSAQSPAWVYILASDSVSSRLKEYEKIIDLHAFDAQIINFKNKQSIHFLGSMGPVWIVINEGKVSSGHNGLLNESSYAYFRDQAGVLYNQFKAQNIDTVSCHFIDASADCVRASIVGFEMASYNFLNIYKNNDVNKIKIKFHQHTNKKSFKLNSDFILSAQLEADAANLARHLVNLPPNDLNPETMEVLIKKDLNFTKNVKINIWDHKKLESEGMYLHHAVGKGSETPPRMIHIEYRPKKKSNKKPIAFVGKGITFDTGGLDIKPSSGMRLMKKDMVGAAAVLALAYWAVHSEYERACDFYLALAENSIDAKSMRPSDVYKSRAGFLVEIDNTDAEGRLVLADVMDVAVTKTGNNEPEIIIDVATLTGAIKVALGTDVAGLFCNNDQLSAQLQKAGQEAGEPNWRMPLVQKYFSSMNSNFADFKNSADGFGSAITAALFLEKFCGGKKWAHLDVYCWADKPTGALSAAGGSGQPVQSLIQWLKSQK